MKNPRRHRLRARFLGQLLLVSDELDALDDGRHELGDGLFELLLLKRIKHAESEVLLDAILTAQANGEYAK